RAPDLLGPLDGAPRGAPTGSIGTPARALPGARSARPGRARRRAVALRGPSAAGGGGPGPRRGPSHGGARARDRPSLVRGGAQDGLLSEAWAEGARRKRAAKGEALVGLREPEAAAAERAPKHEVFRDGFRVRYAWRPRLSLDDEWALINAPFPQSPAEPADWL